MDQSRPMLPDGHGGFAGNDHPAPAGVVTEILAGLRGRARSLPAKLFYDQEGCRLFGEITTLDEYYLTRAEMALLRRHAGEIAAAAQPGGALVEYGASDEAKAETLLASGRFSAYVPIDIAPSALAALEARLRLSRPALAVRVVVGDFMRPLALPASLGDHARFGFFPGSTIGNLDPDAVVSFLERARATLASAAGPTRLVIGVDLRKDPAVLIPAYDDSRGVTAAFNRNILVHVNRVAGGDFDPAAFDHVARWNDQAGRIEMHLVSRVRQTVTVAGERFAFLPGDGIHTESSYKHTEAGFLALAARAGWRGARFWTDDHGLFGVHLLEPSAT